VKCTTDGDCIAGWSCATFTSDATCVGTAPAQGGAQGGAAPAPDCPAPTEIKECVPPYYSLIGDSRGVSHDLGGSTSGFGQEASGGVIPPTADNGSDKGTGDGDSTSSAGCTVTHGGSKTSSTLALFGLLGVLSVLRRRRAP